MGARGILFKSISVLGGIVASSGKFGSDDAMGIDGLEGSGGFCGKSVLGMSITTGGSGFASTGFISIEINRNPKKQSGKAQWESGTSSGSQKKNKQKQMTLS